MCFVTSEQGMALKFRWGGPFRGTRTLGVRKPFLNGDSTLGFRGIECRGRDGSRAGGFSGVLRGLRGAFGSRAPGHPMANKQFRTGTDPGNPTV